MEAADLGLMVFTKGPFKDITILEIEPKGGIWRRWSGFEEHRKKVCDRTDRYLNLTGRGEVLLLSKGLYIIKYLKMLDIQRNIFHWQVINALIKLNIGGQFYYVGINIIVEHILSGRLIIPNEYSFGYMVLQLGFSFSRGSHIDTTYKGPNGGEVLLIV